MASSGTRDNQFKPLYKRFKHKDARPPTSDEVVDTSQTNPSISRRTIHAHEPTVKATIEVIAIERIPGLSIIRNPFHNSTLCSLVEHCLASVPCSANKCNLDAHHDRVHDPCPLWQQCKSHSPDHHRDRSEAQDLFNKLSWVTVGYHYDWTKKVYSKHDYTAFPAIFTDVANAIASVVGMKEGCNMQAGIVNYYHQRMSLGPHTDHSELVQRPLISISLGLSALFQIGDDTLATPPVTLRLQCGDVVVMSASARKAYHAVPRVLTPTEDETWFDSSNGVLAAVVLQLGENGLQAEADYIQSHRININMRQVIDSEDDWPS
eukprot:TRINITY_DN7709_c0_g1_i1.p1 TRINITY_DN7709_c0_g1~~TRINITY_DN7709_c0_g1_i1.p1  ORF type:complete len:332 (+),score=33.13 TRINITY_DN7709_c0_g1_i1:38-997(+)